MADDFDVEAMLEAPFQNGPKTEEEKSKSERSKKRSRSRSRSRRRRHRSRSRSRDRRRRRSRSRDRRRSRSRDRRRSRSRDRRRSRTRDRRRSRSRDRSRTSRSRNETQRPKTPSPPKARSPSPPDRDARTVFCMQLGQRIKSRDLEEFFSAVGKVREVRLIQDKHSGRSKGIAYVEMKELQSIPLALGLSGQRLLGVPIIVQPTQSEKNKVAAAQLSLQQAALGPTKLYVGSLHENITEDMLKGIFSPFGRVTQVEVAKDEAGKSKGYAFITFSEAESAKRALDQLNGFEIAGKAIKLNSVAPSTDLSLFSTLANAPSFLDNESVERAGIDLGTTGRLQLMAKLAEGTGMEVPNAAKQALAMSQSIGLGLPMTPMSLGTGSANGSSAPPIATTCFQLSNMFDPAKESGVGWDTEMMSSRNVNVMAKYFMYMLISSRKEMFMSNVIVLTLLPSLFLLCMVDISQGI